MPYLNLDLDYFDHPKTKRLIALLGEGAEMLPVRLWCHAGKFHAATGILKGYSIKEIEGMSGWRGGDGVAIEALIKVGFLAKTSKGYALHEWLDHEGHLVMFKERAKRAAFKRWGKKDDATSIAKVEAKQCPNLTIPTIPNHTIPNPPKPPRGLLADGFNKFWESYPKKVGRGAAEKSWARIDWAVTKTQQILLAVHSQKESPDWLKEAGKYIPHPATWLNQRRWEDEVSSSGTRGGSSTFFDKIVGRESRPIREKSPMGGLPEL